MGRFQTKRRELDEAGQPIRLYALLDQGGLTSRERQQLRYVPQRSHGVSLYAGSGLDSLEAVGPVLLALPDPRKTSPLTFPRPPEDDAGTDILVRLLSLATDHAARVTWIWASHDMDTLVAHLQTLLHARLDSDGNDAWFFFYHPSHIKVLHERLPEATRRYMFGPLHAWWSLDLDGALVELDGEGLPVPTAWEVLPIPDDVVAVLQREAMPALLHSWLQRTRLNPRNERRYNDELAQIVPLVERARSHGLGPLEDVATFVAYGLRYGVDYDRHPQLAAALADTVAEKGPLATAYRRTRTDVWQELAQSTEQRVRAQAQRDRYEALEKLGHVRLRVLIVNASGIAVQCLCVDPHGTSTVGRQHLGSVDGLRSGEWESTQAGFVSPLPGEKLKLHWDEVNVLPGGRPYRTYRENDIFIEGEVPPDDHSGVLEIRFEKYTQRAVMYPDEDARQHAGRVNE